ncbi:MAG: winged helix-turn-helix transcriptional regulator [Acidimicrobiales bacterium]
MRRKSFEEMNCSVAHALEVVGEWWTMLIVRDCFLGVTRFDEFQSRLGISRNVLTERLDHLVGFGVLVRVPYQDRPVRHDYRLTDKGRDLWLVLTALRQWGDRWEAPEGAPVVLDHKACDHATTVVPVCSACGEGLDARSVRARSGPGATRQPAAELAG